MSFFQRMLASVGIGAAKVDTRLETPRLRPGDEVRGTVFIRGGSVEQRIDGIYLQLMTRYIVEKDDHKIPQTAIIGKFRITEPLVVRPNETIDLPFSFVLPLDTPTTRGGTPVWLKTGLDIDNAVDPTDHDHIEVDPHPYAQAVLDAVQSLGFRLRKAQCEYASRLGGRLPFVQEFEFAPPPIAAAWKNSNSCFSCGRRASTCGWKSTGGREAYSACSSRRWSSTSVCSDCRSMKPSCAIRGRLPTDCGAQSMHICDKEKSRSPRLFSALPADPNNPRRPRIIRCLPAAHTRRTRCPPADGKTFRPPATAALRAQTARGFRRNETRCP